MKLESSNISDYLKKDHIINFDHQSIIDQCEKLNENISNETELIKIIYEFVRDDIRHSSDIGEQKVTCHASEVLEFGHGICCAKSNLLTAMLRYFKIPAGFCYQKLSSDDKNKKVLHGLNAVYLKEYDKWIRLDARGNKEGVDAQFSVVEEKIARQVKKEFGEEDHEMIFADPNEVVIDVLRKSNSRQELWKHWDLGLKDLFPN